MNDTRILALRRALERAPDDHDVRAMLADELLAAGRDTEAAQEFAALLDHDALALDRYVAGGRAALRAGDIELARRFLAEAGRRGVVEGVTALRDEIDGSLAKRGVLVLVPGGRRDAPETGESGVDEEEPLTFADIGGLDDVKKTVHRMIVLPFQRPEIFARFGRRAGGGILLYGPPGCGKTMLARAAAGECGVPFLNVRLEDVLDPYFGQSERNLHAAFQAARERAPCVLFLDELDAIAFPRHRHRGNPGRSLVDQLLQELDAIGADNKDLLVLAATNAPWDVDDALHRPGRFDRIVFVPPPDEAARRAILDVLVRDLPHAGLDPAALAKATALWSGADLAALIARATDRVIEETLAGGGEPPLTQAHCVDALRDMRASTLEWLSRARNYVEFANAGERYADVEAFLQSKEAKRAR